MTYFLGGSGFIFDDKFIRGQTASNSVDASIINIFQKNDNVGIGNSNPIFPLDVNGNIKTNSALIIGSSTYTDVNLNNTNTKAIYSSNTLNNKLNLSGGTMTGELSTRGFSANNQVSKFQNGNTTNAVFIEASVGAYYGKTAITFNGFSSGNNNHSFVNPTKSKWSMQVNQVGNADDMGFYYVTPNSRATAGTGFLSFSNVGSYASNGTPLINTGVNNANPQFPLDVNGIIKTNSALVINSSTYTETSLNNTSNAAYWSSNNIANINNNFLPITGGTLTGNLNFKQNLYIGASSTDDFICNIPINKNFSIYNTGGIPLFQINENMTRNYTFTTFNNNVGIKTEATNNFALNVNGVFQTSSAIINGNITVSGNINVNNNITGNKVFTNQLEVNGTINASGNIVGNAFIYAENFESRQCGTDYLFSRQGAKIDGILSAINITTNSANINGKFYNNRQLANYIAIDVNATSGSLNSYSPIYPLDVIGSTRNSTGQWLSGSDNRVKNNIIDADLEICYNNIKKLKLKNFQWNDDYTKQNNLKDANVIGFISQEVKPIFPKSIFESNSWGYDDFMDLNCDQIYKSMYGALQYTIEKLEKLTQEFNEYKINHV
jgi:hypothetical protein